ncbi:hypothetical protein FKP32DRAFT_1580972 [Trametes sanguinea]|nr:hypothetical protein FKP32DRAFT_1580972 [Trametes sanguinea]
MGLNNDIIEYIISLSEPKYACRWMETCRFFYAEVPRILLVNQEITVNTAERLSLFLWWLLIDGLRRFPFVRSLAIGICYPSEQVARELLAAIPLMRGLSHLHIYHGKTVLKHIPALADVITALGSLRTLHVQVGSLQTLRMFKCLQSTLVDAKVDFQADYVLTDQWQGTLHPVLPDDWREYHPLDLLAHSSSTLKTLVISGSWYGLEQTAPRAAPVYPRMQRLTVTGAPPPPTVVLVRAFPNLTHLCVRAGHDSYLDHPATSHTTLAKFDARRASNYATTRKSRPVSWDKLEEVAGCACDLFALGLTCPVENIELSHVEDKHFYMLGPMLADTCPRKLYARCWPDRNSDGTYDVFSPLSGPGGSQLTALYISLFIATASKDDRVAAVRAILESLLSSVQHAPLQELQLDLCIRVKKSKSERLKEYPPPSPFPKTRLRCTREHWVYREITPATHADDHAPTSGRNLKEIDLQAYVRRLLQRVPTLCDVHVSVDALLFPTFCDVPFSVDALSDTCRQVSMRNGQMQYVDVSHRVEPPVHSSQCD